MLKGLSISTLVVLALPAVAAAQQIAARTMIVNGAPHVAESEHAPAPMPARADAGGAFMDEYGNLYNSRGDRVGHAPSSATSARASR